MLIAFHLLKVKFVVNYLPSIFSLFPLHLFALNYISHNAQGCCQVLASILHENELYLYVLGILINYISHSAPTAVDCCYRACPVFTITFPLMSSIHTSKGGKAKDAVAC